jgi:hypothetical protein
MGPNEARRPVPVLSVLPTQFRLPFHTHDPKREGNFSHGLNVRRIPSIRLSTELRTRMRRGSWASLWRGRVTRVPFHQINHSAFVLRAHVPFSAAELSWSMLAF